jgi:hypothetical protein
MMEQSIPITDATIENIGELLIIAKDLSNERLEIEKKEEWIKNKIKIFLKERSIRDFEDKKTNITVRLDMSKKETVDTERVKQILSEKQWAQVIKVTTYERLLIITPEVRERMKHFAKKQSSYM